MRYSLRLILVPVGEVGQPNVRPVADVELAAFDLHPENSRPAMERLARASQEAIRGMMKVRTGEE